jgi:hypothetical protein
MGRDAVERREDIEVVRGCRAGGLAAFEAALEGSVVDVDEPVPVAGIAAAVVMPLRSSLGGRAPQRASRAPATLQRTLLRPLRQSGIFRAAGEADSI